MRRRTVLTASTLALTGLAGCSSFLGDDSETGDDPEQTLRTFLTAAIEGDRDRARDLVHPDGPMMEEVENSEQENTQQDLDITIEETEVRTQDEGTAMVVAEYTLSDQQGNSQTDRVEYELRTHDGDWRIWDAGVPGGSPPNVSFDYTDQPAQDAVVITHGGGDTIQHPERITVTVDGSSRGTLAEIIGSPIAAGDSGTVSVPTDTTGTLRLQWRGGDRSYVLGRHEYDVQ